MQTPPTTTPSAPTPMGPKGEVRSVFLVMGLGLLTCGVYSAIWFFKMAKEINVFLGYERMSALKVWLLTSVTCGLYAFYFMLVDGREIVKEVQAKAGLPQSPPLIAGPYQIQGALNKVWQALPG